MKKSAQIVKPSLATPLLSHFVEARWQALCATLGVDAAARFTEVARAYAEPQRAYHTAQHIEECLTIFDTVACMLHDAPLVELCIWLHDLVYEPKRSDNEARSADIACEWFAALAPDRLQRLRDYILATKRHEPSPNDMDLQALLDIDLAILASSPERFREYGKQVRFEYAFVPWSDYVVKRREFLKTIAQRTPLFHHPALAPQLEPLARRNLAADDEARDPFE
jgi:predicted metal-dependent HD superfamily phosphohydrolase